MDGERSPDRARWRRIEQILDRVLELPPEARTAFLDAACAEEPDLRPELDDLLAADARADGFLEGPAAAEVQSWLDEPPTEDTGCPVLPACNPGSQVGHYRVTSKLGRGGMGEVYEAFDARLERTVALKRVHLRGSGSSASRRRRFRREARAAAGLSHPAIVQIFDLLEHGGEDWLVMERVEGRPLSAVLDEGPLSEAQALPLARQIAEGLAAAHERGVVHRDLKTENVIVTPENRAKILDFGLAKRLAAPVSPAGGDTRLTGEHQVLGTFRSMSPEQIRGIEVDGRSDLFSFGILLYEMLTGESPFEDPDPAVALRRTCAEDPTPPAQLNQALSPELSDLILRLLEKDPAHRPQRASEVAAALSNLETGRSGRRARRRRLLLVLGVSLGIVAVSVVAGILRMRSSAHRPPLYVVVAPPELLGSQDLSDADLLRVGLTTAANQALARLHGLAALSPEQAGTETRDPRALARALAADEVLRSRLACRPERCVVTLSRLAASDGRVLWLSSFEAAPDDTALLATAVDAQLRSAYPGHRPRKEAPEVPSSAVYTELLRLRRDFETKQGPGDEKLLERLEFLRQRAPRFLEVYLLEAEIIRQQYFFSRQADELEHGFELLQQARRLAPHDPRPLHRLFDLAAQGGRWDLAKQTLSSLEALEPASAEVLKRRAQALAHDGSQDRAVALMRRAAQLHPAANVLLSLAYLEYNDGEVAEARATLERLLVRAPRHFRAMSFLAQLELLQGDPERAVELYEQLIARSPEVTELSNIGLAYQLAGRLEDAEAAYQRAHEREPDNPVATLNLADALQLLGRGEEAAKLYRTVVDQVDLEHPDTSWQQLTVSAQALAHLGRTQEAVATVQRALQAEPDNPQVAFEAALVYAVSGERTSALVNAERALELGVSRTWFTLPWFDDLRPLLSTTRAAG